MIKSSVKSIGILGLFLLQFSVCFSQRDSVLVCNVAFKDSTFNNQHAGSGFILRYKDKLYGITAKHVLFFAKTDSMKTISFGNQLQSWNFTSRVNPMTSILAGKLLNKNPEEAIEMPPNGDWLILKSNKTSLKM